VQNHEDEHEHNHNEKAKRNINVDAAYLHVLGDMIMSIGVVIASLIIYFVPSATIADPICTYIFSIIVCITVYPICKNCIQVLMEGSPDEIDVEALLSDIKQI
jgi:zinc transporter 2